MYICMYACTPMHSTMYVLTKREKIKFINAVSL